MITNRQIDEIIDEFVGIILDEHAEGGGADSIDGEWRAMNLAPTVVTLSQEEFLRVMTATVFRFLLAMELMEREPSISPGRPRTSPKDAWDQVADVIRRDAD